MTWSSTGSAATYPTLQPTGLDPNLTVSLTFRLAPDVGIVYVTGTLTVGSAYPSNASPVFTIPAAFRPLPQPNARYNSSVLLWTQGSQATLDLNIGPDGNCLFARTASPNLLGLYNIRDFYFTNVVPG